MKERAVGLGKPGEEGQNYLELMLMLLSEKKRFLGKAQLSLSLLCYSKERTFSCLLDRRQKSFVGKTSQFQILFQSESHLSFLSSPLPQRPQSWRGRTSSRGLVLSSHDSQLVD